MIDISKQLLTLTTPNNTYEYSVSTAKNGAGQREGSGKTPLGNHYVRAMIGRGAPIDSVFVGRRTTAEIYSDSLASDFPKRDWILSRILWLCGKEKGLNRLGGVDSMRRFIYIHGTPDSEPMGIPLSHGCIRMRNRDIIQLFDLIPIGTHVLIKA
jgi:lipoprotein-anchoring transpeptidase ErfK/SrfK